MEIISIFDLPLEIQIHKIWCHLSPAERLRIREISRSCNKLYRRLYPMEYSKQHSFLTLRNLIDDFFEPHATWMSCFDTNFIYKLADTNLSILLNQSQTPDDLKFVEKNIDRIALRSFPDIRHFGAAAAMLCNMIMHKLPRNFSNHRTTKLMHGMIEDVGFRHTFNITSLSEILHYGLKEWRKTSNKYNRYTRFGLRHLSLIEAASHLHLNEYKSKLFREELGLLWSHIPSVHFIEDYLECAALRKYGRIAWVPLRLIVDEAMKSNATWNDERLRLIEKYPPLFFDFSHILSVAAAHWNVDELKLINLVTFFVRKRMISWEAVNIAVNRQYRVTRTRMLRFVRNYVHHRLVTDWTLTVNNSRYFGAGNI